MNYWSLFFLLFGWKKRDREAKNIFVKNIIIILIIIIYYYKYIYYFILKE